MLLLAGLQRGEGGYDLGRTEDGSGVVWEIDVESGMHHLVRVIRRRVFDHRHFVAELGSIGTVASMQVCAIIPMTMS